MSRWCAGMMLLVLLFLSYEACSQKNKTEQSPAQPLASTKKQDAERILGENCVFTLKAPTGWVLKNWSGVRAGGPDAEVVPLGSDWPASVRIDVFALQKDTRLRLRVPRLEPRIMTFEEIIQEDDHSYPDAKNDVLSSAPWQQIGPSLLARGARKVVIKRCEWGNNIAFKVFIDEPNVVVFIDLFAWQKEVLQKSLPAFQELIQSYCYLGENVENPGSSAK